MGSSPLTREVSEFYFYWSKVDFQRCACCRCARSCPVTCVTVLRPVSMGLTYILIDIKLVGNETSCTAWGALPVLYGRSRCLSVLHILVCMLIPNSGFGPRPQL